MNEILGTSIHAPRVVRLERLDARFVDGADDVHRESVARQILRAYEAPLDDVPTECVPRRREATRAKFADVLGEVAIQS